MSAADNLYPSRQDAAEGSYLSAFAPALPALPNLSRSEALELGALVDVTDLARRHGFLVPVAVSRNLWDDLQAVPEAYQTGDLKQDVTNRLGDMLFMARWFVAKEPLLQIREMVFTAKLPLSAEEEGCCSEDGSCSRMSDDYTVRLVNYQSHPSPSIHGGNGYEGGPVLTLFRQGER